LPRRDKATSGELVSPANAAKSEMNATGFGLPQLPEREARGRWQVKGVRDIDGDKDWQNIS
jgi:hypothetical protein